MNTMPLYIFDLDGTLADLKHRRHFVEKPRCMDCGIRTGAVTCGNCGLTRPDGAPAWRPNWDAFHAACVNDTPIAAIIDVHTRLHMSRADIWVWSGRMETVRAQTVEWLHTNTFFYSHDQETALKMRPAGDYTPDDVLKESWLHAMSPEDRTRLVMVFDDRDRVVNMWRRNGVVCAQVAPGDF